MTTTETTKAPFLRWDLCGSTESMEVYPTCGDYVKRDDIVKRLRELQKETYPSVFAKFRILNTLLTELGEKP